jgi:hypothetical protein
MPENFYQTKRRHTKLHITLHSHNRGDELERIWYEAVVAYLLCRNVRKVTKTVTTVFEPDAFIIYVTGLQWALDIKLLSGSRFSTRIVIVIGIYLILEFQLLRVHDAGYRNRYSDGLPAGVSFPDKG